MDITLTPASGPAFLTASRILTRHQPSGFASGRDRRGNHLRI